MSALLSTEKAAPLLGLHPKDLQYLARRGQVPHTVTDRGAYRFERADVEAIVRREAAYPPSPARRLFPCGHPATYRRHLRNGEPVDDACLEANARRVAGQSAQQRRRRAERAASGASST